jgi:DNA polymerase IV
VPADSQMAFLHALPANALWGVGPATRAALTRLGVETIGDIAGLHLNTLVGAVGPATGRHLHDLANGRDPREVVPDTAAKSVSVEETYNDDLRSSGVIETALLSHALSLSGRLRRSGLRARTISLKIRYPDFRTVTRSQTLGSAVDGTRDLYRIAADLLTAVDRGDTPVRLLGLAGSSLEPATDPNQLHLDADRWAAVEDAAADVRERFGDAAVRPARLLDGQGEC